MENKRPTQKICTYCRTTGDYPMKCSACKTMIYCSRECQMSDWSRHKELCAGDYVVGKVMETLTKDEKMSAIQRHVLKGLTDDKNIVRVIILKASDNKYSVSFTNQELDSKPEGIGRSDDLVYVAYTYLYKFPTSCIMWSIIPKKDLDYIPTLTTDETLLNLSTFIITDWSHISFTLINA